MTGRQLLDFTVGDSHHDRDRPRLRLPVIVTAGHDGAGDRPNSSSPLATAAGTAAMVQIRATWRPAPSRIADATSSSVGCKPLTAPPTTEDPTRPLVVSAPTSANTPDGADVASPARSSARCSGSRRARPASCGADERAHGLRHHPPAADVGRARRPSGRSPRRDAGDGGPAAQPRDGTRLRGRPGQHADRCAGALLVRLALGDEHDS